MVLFSAVCFGGIPIIVTIATRAGAPLVGVLFWRYLIGATLLTVVAGGPRRLAAPGRRALGIITAAGLLQATVAFVSLSALRYVPAATLTFLFYTFPAWVTLFAAARGAEPLTLRRVVALALALSGIAVMVGSPLGARGDARGVALALASAFLYALYVPMLGGFQRLSGTRLVSSYAAAGAALAFGLVALARPAELLALPPQGWIAALLLGVVSTAMGFMFFLGGLAVLGPVRTAILSTIEPFCTAALGALVLGQRITLATVLGGLLIASAVVLLQWRSRGIVPSASDETSPQRSLIEEADPW